MATLENLVYVLIFLITLICLKCIFSKRKLYVLSWKLPGPLAFPIIGNGLEFLCDDDEIFERAIGIVSRYPSPMRFWFGPKFTLVIRDPERASKIMSSTNFIVKDDVYRFMKEFNGEGLISGSGPKWKRDRRLMAPIFSKRSVTEYFDSILHHINLMIDILDKKVDGPCFNIEKYLHRCTTDFVSETILGVDTDAQNGTLEEFLKHITRMYEIVHVRIIKVWLQVEWMFRLTHYWIEQESGKKYLHGFLRKVLREVEDRRTNQRKNCKPFESLIDQILDIRDKNPDFATENELVHHLCTLYSASEDTVTTIGAFTLLLFGMYPEIQERAFTEIKEVLGNQDELILEDISKLDYLQMCINDILRLFPIAPFIMRVALEDFPLDDFVIPKGSSVVVSIHNIHRDPKLWEKPNEFYPEHFLPEAVEKRHKFAFLPFSAGPRGCLGKPYSYMALAILVARIVKKYQISADGKLEDVKLKTDISVRTRDHLYPIRISRRNN